MYLLTLEVTSSVRFVYIWSGRESRGFGMAWTCHSRCSKKKIYNHAFCECTASVYYTVYIVTSGGETFQLARAEWHNLFCWGKVITTFFTGSWTFSPHNNFPLEEQSSLSLISLANALHNMHSNSTMSTFDMLSYIHMNELNSHM